MNTILVSKEKPKVLQINVSANWGSTGRIAEGINRAAQKAGWDTTIAYSRIANPSESKLYRIGGKIDILIAVLETRLFDRAGLAMRHATKKLIEYIKTTQPNIVHLHNIHGYVINYEMLFKYLNKTTIKVVWTFHDFWAITGHCFHFCGVGCCKWKELCYDCPLHREYPSSLTDFSKRNFKIKKESFTANKSLTIASVSAWVDSYIGDSFLKNKKHIVINNGVNISVFKPTLGFSHPEVKENDFLILGVASQWSVGKGFEDFVALSKMLQSDEKIFLIGLPQKMINHLPNNIIGLERTNSVQELTAAYTRANVFVSFSKAETFGLTIIEAMACGTPAIVYDNSAPPYHITDNTGFVVPNGDYCKAYSRIQEVKEKGADYYTHKCIKHARLHYDENEGFQKYVALYNELINRNKK